MSRSSPSERAQPRFSFPIFVLFVPLIVQPFFGGWLSRHYALGAFARASVIGLFGVVLGGGSLFVTRQLWPSSRPLHSSGRSVALQGVVCVIAVVLADVANSWLFPR